MEFIVDQEVCVGCGACAAICPKVFEMVDGKAVVVLNPVGAEDKESALEAESACPVMAITHK